MKPRSLLREERHPNAVTAPPINRGSMTPRPWRGFWNSIGTALLSTASGLLPPYGQNPGQRPAQAGEPLEPWQNAANWRRAIFVGLTLAWTLMAGLMFWQLQPDPDYLVSLCLEQRSADAPRLVLQPTLPQFAGPLAAAPVELDAALRRRSPPRSS